MVALKQRAGACAIMVITGLSLLLGSLRAEDGSYTCESDTGVCEGSACCVNEVTGSCFTDEEICGEMICMDDPTLPWCGED